LPGYGSLPKVAVVQAMSPDRFLITHWLLIPNDTCRVAVPTLQVPPSSAHFEKPLGQSTAWAGMAMPPSTAATALDRR
jgi:hypothetical protein